MLAQLYRICDRKWVPVQNWHAPEPILDDFKAAMKDPADGNWRSPPQSVAASLILSHMCHFTSALKTSLQTIEELQLEAC